MRSFMKECVRHTRHLSLLDGLLTQWARLPTELESLHQAMVCPGNGFNGKRSNFTMATVLNIFLQGVLEVETRIEKVGRNVDEETCASVDRCIRS